MPSAETLLLIYIAVASAAAFAAMGIDKRAAKNGSYRISERTLMTLGAVGGAFGGLLGMLVFRHKTKHTKFKLGMPLLLLLNAACVALAFWLIRK